MRKGKRKLRHEFPRISIGWTGSAEMAKANGSVDGRDTVLIRYAPGVCKSSGENHAKLVRSFDITSLESAIKATTVRHRSGLVTSSVGGPEEGKVRTAATVGFLQRHKAGETQEILTALQTAGRK